MKEKYIQGELANQDFFRKCEAQLKNIAIQSRVEQEKARKLKKIVKLQNQNEPTSKNLSTMIIDNIVIDYLRCNKLNYSYSVLMRERDLVTDQIMLKSILLQKLGLKDSYYKLQRIDVTVIQVMLQKMGDLLAEQKEFKQIGSQVQLLNKDNTVNNRVVNQVRIAEARLQVEKKEKQHYQGLLQAMKKQLTITLKDDLKKDYDKRIKDLKAQYEKQVQTLKDKNKQILINNPKSNPKIQEYLTQIVDLQNKNMELSLINRQLEKDKITHNCSANETIIEKQAQIRKERKYLSDKKKQYQFALKNLHTSVEELAMKKQKLNQQPKQTDLFVADMKRNRENKDHLIEQVYGRMIEMDKRIQNISKDNDYLREENRQFNCKIKQLKQQIQLNKQNKQQSRDNEQNFAKLMIKPKSKDVKLSVNQSQIKQAFNQHKKQHIIDQSQISSDNTEQQDENIQKQLQYKRTVSALQSEMKLIKNKLRFMVQDFI